MNTGAPSRTGAADGSSSRRPRGWARAIAACALAGTLLFGAGFVTFAMSIGGRDHDPVAVADGIVALTGGQGRIEDALELLARGYGGRLLITGVNERTGRDSIGRLAPIPRDLLDCCVDLDYRARDTVGNATETARWVRERGFRSLVVVTSDYHLPRALVELDGVLPGIRKLPYAVVNNGGLTGWDHATSRLRVLLSEYVKFLAASVRTRVAGRGPEPENHAVAARPVASPVAETPRAG